MKIIIKDHRYISDFKKISSTTIIEDIKFMENNVIILGNFDGVHLGHHNIILEAINKARAKNLKVLIYLFKNHKTKKDNLITTLVEKLYILSKYDIDYIYIEDFENIFNLSCEEFVENILINKLKAEEVFCGFNYSFGKDKKGDVKILENLLKDRANLNVISPIIFNLENNKLVKSKLEDLKSYLDKGYYVISSTFIKTLLENGKLKEMKKLLGHEYILIGEVKKGKQLARTLGFPTANIDSRNKIYPIFGVYGSKVRIEKDTKEYNGITNIGKNPTIENSGIHIETNIYDFNKDIYGKVIIISLYENIRLEKKMSSLDELKNQIFNDKESWIKKLNEYE